MPYTSLLRCAAQSEPSYTPLVSLNTEFIEDDDSNEQFYWEPQLNEDDHIYHGDIPPGHYMYFYFAKRILWTGIKTSRILFEGMTSITLRTNTWDYMYI